jgi:hypothetical protein
MSFLRHGEIYPCDEGAISRPRPRSSPWMSLQLVIPGRLLSSRARFRFTSPSYTANHQPRPTMLQQRTAKCRLTDCLSRGVQSTYNLTGLNNNTTYYYRMVFWDSDNNGSQNGQIDSFTTGQ